jgi:glycosyltransferase involved in cell wall biosynthesis
MRVSVITVTLNAEQFLLECLESVSAQGDALCEHIIVDGGSTDSTLDIVEKHAANDFRVRWISEPDKGIAEAMNKGLRMAKGEIVCFLHADDYFCDENVLDTISEEFRSIIILYG